MPRSFNKMPGPPDAIDDPKVKEGTDNSPSLDIEGLPQNGQAQAAESIVQEGKENLQAAR